MQNFLAKFFFLSDKNYRREIKKNEAKSFKIRIVATFLRPGHQNTHDDGEQSGKTEPEEGDSANSDQHGTADGAREESSTRKKTPT